MVAENPELDPTVPAWAIRTFIQGLANAILSLPEEEQRRFLGDLETQTQTNRGRIPPHLRAPVQSIQRGFFQELAQALVNQGRGRGIAQ